MRFTTKTEYGLVCLIYMANSAKSDPEDLVTIKDIVRAERFSEPYVAKILNKLRVGKIIASHQGKQGGYALAKPASEITLKQVIEALEGQTFDVFCRPKIRHEIVCTHFNLCGLMPIWNRTKEVLDQFYSSVTLEMMTKNGEPHVQPVAHERNQTRPVNGKG